MRACVCCEVDVDRCVFQCFVRVDWVTEIHHDQNVLQLSLQVLFGGNVVDSWVYLTKTENCGSVEISSQSFTFL